MQLCFLSKISFIIALFLAQAPFLPRSDEIGRGQGGMAIDPLSDINLSS